MVTKVNSLHFLVIPLMIVTIIIITSFYFNQGESQVSIGNNSTSLKDVIAAKAQYMLALNGTKFQTFFSTFIEDGSAQGFGIYTGHTSNVFNPKDPVVLYLEPVGFGYREVFDEQGNILYQINLTADFQVKDMQRKQISEQRDIPVAVLNSHNKNTEVFIIIRADMPQVSSGEYMITYVIKDGSSGKSFELEKLIRIAQIVHP